MSILAAEDGVIALLTAAKGTTNLKVDSLPGDWDQDMLRTLRRYAPGLLVAVVGGQAEPGQANPVARGQVEVYVVTSHPSGEAARRRGNAQAPGAYELIERLVVPALHGQAIADVGTLEFTGFSNLYTGDVEKQGLAVYGVTFALPIPFNVLAAAEQLDDFATFYAQYDLPAHQAAPQHQAWLAGDYTTSTPDARDQVALPTT